MNLDPAALADLLQRGGGYGVAALIACAWLFERRQNVLLQRWLVRLGTAGLKVNEKDVTST